MGHYVVYVTNFFVYLLASWNPLAIFSLSSKPLPHLVDAPCWPTSPKNLTSPDPSPYPFQGPPYPIHKGTLLPHFLLWGRWHQHYTAKMKPATWLNKVRWRKLLPVSSHFFCSLCHLLLNHPPSHKWPVARTPQHSSTSTNYCDTTVCPVSCSALWLAC